MLAPVRRTLIVTNDFPPRLGGIQSFVHSVAMRQPPGAVVVYTSEHAGSGDFDRQQPFPVIRHPTGVLLPTPAARRRIVAALQAHQCTAVWFGAAAPLGLLAPHLRRAGAQRLIATTHGHEVGWAMLPGARQALRRIGAACDVVTYLGEYTRRRLAGAFGAGATLRRLAPGVDIETFHPGVDGQAVRARHGLTGRPVIVCVSRLVARKGQDVLIRALPAIRREVPDAALLLVGRPNRERFATGLRHRSEREGLAADVVFAGGVDAAELPQYFAAGDVFAMPCRTRRFGLDVEGLGIVYLEASALGRAVVAGASGGAPEAVRPGQTGWVVDGRDPDDVAVRIGALLRDRAERDRMGRAGRRWVEQEWTWDVAAAQLHELVQG
jgi:phosphatidylinositol alpha-1,6-mannosyltransferase